jgi:hypothetical protein
MRRTTESRTVADVNLRRLKPELQQLHGCVLPTALLAMRPEIQHN